MVERKRIGLRFAYNDYWIAGAYYILNIVHALNTLKDNEKPIIIILAENENNFKIVENETNYPFLEYFKFPFLIPKKNIFQRIVNKISRLIQNKNVFINKEIQPDIDFLYPLELSEINIKKLKKVNWVPDFQEEHLPHFFSQKEVFERKKYQRKILCKGYMVVFSSKNAQNDFNKLYPKAKVKQKVLNFAVTLPSFENQEIKVLLKKYNLPDNYFFSPNQFWAHKNHIVVLRAVKKLKEKGINVFVAFSGKERDYRNLKNFDFLKAYIRENRLEKHIKFLGFIDRLEQLCLIKHSILIIQPSLFEGWSTVVEDVKSLNKFIIVSNLEVHIEQINENVHFFEPTNQKQLAGLLEYYSENPPKEETLDYSKGIKKFGQDFLEIVKSAT